MNVGYESEHACSSSGGLACYVQLQRQIHDTLREAEPRMDRAKRGFSTGESYESRSVELLEFFSRFIFAAGLPWQGRNLLSRKR
jgi:hypothetical protein